LVILATIFSALSFGSSVVDLRRRNEG